MDEDLNVDNLPTDGITALQFNPQSDDQLLVASWDSQLRLYELSSNSVKSTMLHRAAVLSCAFDPNPRFAFSGSLDTWVRRVDIDTEDVRVLGAHDAATTSVVYAHETNQLVSGSWDMTIALWDPRKGNPKSRISSHKQSERVHWIDTVNNKLVVATAGRRVAIWDLRNMQDPIEERVTSLKFGTSSLKCMPGGEGFAIGSIEGRVAIEYFDKDPAVQAKKYAFKCHRQTIPGGDLVYPVNALAFHPIYGTLATGGADGTLAAWDHLAKKRLRLYPRAPVGVSALAFSADGKKIAVGLSFMEDVSDATRREELSKKGMDFEHVGLVVKSVGEEYKRKS